MYIITGKWVGVDRTLSVWPCNERRTELVSTFHALDPRIKDLLSHGTLTLWYCSKSLPKVWCIRMQMLVEIKVISISVHFHHGFRNQKDICQLPNLAKSKKCLPACLIFAANYSAACWPRKWTARNEETEQVAGCLGLYKIFFSLQKLVELRNYFFWMRTPILIN